MELSLSTRAVGDRAVIETAGQIDVYTAAQFRQEINDAIDAGKKHLIIDLNQIVFLDSTGLGVLVGGLKRVRTLNGSLSVVCSDPDVLRPFQITGLDKVFAIHDTVDRAVEAVTGDPAGPGQASRGST
ncbi:MAG: STAS domain-containing protein [Carbonactinosporaceae bacterium]